MDILDKWKALEQLNNKDKNMKTSKIHQFVAIHTND